MTCGAPHQLLSRVLRTGLTSNPTTASRSLILSASAPNASIMLIYTLSAPSHRSDRTTHLQELLHANLLPPSRSPRSQVLTPRDPPLRRKRLSAPKDRRTRRSSELAVPARPDLGRRVIRVEMEVMRVRCTSRFEVLPVSV